MDLLVAFYEHSYDSLGLQASRPSASDLNHLLSEFRATRTVNVSEWHELYPGAGMDRREMLALTAPLIEADIARSLRILDWDEAERIVDFGSGRWPLFELFEKFCSQGGYYPLDPEYPGARGVPEELAPKRSILFARHVLHHLQERDLAGLLLALPTLGSAFVVDEDDPGITTEKSLCSECSQLNGIWNQLPPAGRLDILAANDLWANVVCYGRTHEDQTHRHMLSPEIVRRAEEVGYAPLLVEGRGFVHSRPHGVPSYLIVLLDGTE